MFYPLHPLRAFMYKNDAPISSHALRNSNSKLYHYLSQELRIIDEDKLSAINNCLLSYPQGINLNLIRTLLHCLSQHRLNDYSDKAKCSLKLMCDIALNSLQNIIPTQTSVQQFDSDYHHQNYLHNIITILKSFAKLPIDLIANESLIIECLAILKEQIHNLDRFQIALTLNSLPKLFLRPGSFKQQKPFIQKLLDAAEKLYLNFDSNANGLLIATNNPTSLAREEIVTLLCALPKLEIKLQHYHHLIAFLLAETGQNVNSFNLKEVSSLLIVIHKLGVDIKFHETLISNLFVHAYEMIQTIIPRDPFLVSNMLYTLNIFSEINIDYKVRKNLLSILLKPAMQLVFQFNCVEITMLMSSLHRLGVNSYTHNDFIENLLAQILILITQANNNNTSILRRQFSEFETVQILSHLFHLNVNIYTHHDLVDELLKLASNYVYTFSYLEFALLFFVLRNFSKHNFLILNHNTLLVELFKRAKIITKDLGNLEIAYILNALPDLMNNDFDNPFNRELIDILLEKALEIVEIINLREILLILESVKRSPQFIVKHQQCLEMLEQRYALLQTQPEQHIPLINTDHMSDEPFNANSQQKINDNHQLDSNVKAIPQKGQQGCIFEFKPSHNALKRSYHVGMIKLDNLRSEGKIQLGDEFEQWFSNQYIIQTTHHIGLPIIHHLYENGHYAEATDKLGSILEAVNKKLNLHNSQKSTSVAIQTSTPPSEIVSECSIQSTSNSSDVSPNSNFTCEENSHEKMFDLAFPTTSSIPCVTDEPNEDPATACVTEKNDGIRPQQSNLQHENANNITTTNLPVLSKRKLRQLRKASMPKDKPIPISESHEVRPNVQPQKNMASMLFSFWKEIIKCCPLPNSVENSEENYDKLKIP